MNMLTPGFSDEVALASFVLGAPLMNTTGFAQRTGGSASFNYSKYEMSLVGADKLRGEQ